MGTLYFGWGPALLGGLVGALVMTVFWYACRAIGWMKLDWGMFLGSFFLPPGQRALATGLSWHFAMGLLFGVVYAYILSSAGYAPSAGNALALGIIHSIVALLLLFPATRANPVLRKPATQAYDGADLTFYALGFPIFGLVFGAVYSFYDTWVSAWGMDPARFWLTAFALIAIALVIGIASFRLIPERVEKSPPMFSAAMPDRQERALRLRRLRDEGLLTQAEFEEELAEIDGER